MTDHAGNIIPLRFGLRLQPPWFVQEIMVHWLDLDVSRQVPLHELEALRGWRNREVHAYIAVFDWTAAMFPHPVEHEYVHPSQKFTYLHQPRRHVPLVRSKRVA